MALDRDARYEVHFHIQGAFNKLYKADTDSDTALMRVSTPHMSEVTTIELVRQETEMPIPKIIASDESDHRLWFGMDACGAGGWSIFTQEVEEISHAR